MGNVRQLTADKMDEKHKAKIQASMEQAAYWMVQKGLMIIDQSGLAGVKKDLISRWSCQLWVEPRIDDGRYLVLFRIKGGGIFYEIHCLQRREIGAIYEYWLLKITAEKWSTETTRAEFLVTKTDRLAGVRQLLRQGNQFFDSYEIGGQMVVELPLDDLRLLYDMQPWRFPENYKRTKLVRTEVRLNEDGIYSLHGH